MILSAFKSRVGRPRGSRNTNGGKRPLINLARMRSFGDVMEGIIYHGCVEIRNPSGKLARAFSKMDIDQQVAACRRSHSNFPKTLPVEMDIDTDFNMRSLGLILSQISLGPATTSKLCQPRRRAGVNKRQFWQGAQTKTSGANCLWR